MVRLWAVELKQSRQKGQDYYFNYYSSLQNQ